MVLQDILCWAVSFLASLGSKLKWQTADSWSEAKLWSNISFAPFHSIPAGTADMPAWALWYGEMIYSVKKIQEIDINATIFTGLVGGRKTP